MSKYPRLTEMGIENPEQIEKFAVFSIDNTDILRITYDRKKGSMLPVSKRFKFPQAKKSVLVDGGSRQTRTLYESSTAFREVLLELEKLKSDRARGKDVAAMIREEFRLMQEDIALRTSYIESLLERLKS